jgi:hypothetical protein
VILLAERVAAVLLLPSASPTAVLLLAERTCSCSSFFFLALPNTFSTNRKMQLVYGVEQ